MPVHCSKPKVAPPRIMFMCAGCRGRGVTRDADVAWNEIQQEWRVVRTYDTGFCVDCDTETTLVEGEMG